jgi:D-alanyl-D-alanine carboxypeptidase
VFPLPAGFADPTPLNLGWGDPRAGEFDVVRYDIGEGVRLTVRNGDVGAVFAELVRRLMAAGWDGPADPVVDDWGYNRRLKRWAEAAGYTMATAPLSAWSEHAWGTAIDLDTVANPMLARRPADPWAHCNLPRSTSAIAGQLGIGWGGDWSEPWDPQHFQIALSPYGTRLLAEQIWRTRAQEDDMFERTDRNRLIHVDDVLSKNNIAGRVNELTADVAEIKATLARIEAAIASPVPPAAA